MIMSIFLFGCGGEHHHRHGANAHMNKMSFEELVEKFESPERATWQKPNDVIGLLGEIKDKTILDIGAGTGYFSFRMAEKGAKVIAADVDDRFLKYIEEKKMEIGDSNITARKTKYDDPLLKTGEVHHAIIVNTYHHIEDRVAYFKKVANGLKAEGSLMVVDFKKKETAVGPPKKHKIASDKVIEELKKAGFKSFQTNKDVLKNQYIIIGRKTNMPNFNQLSIEKQTKMWDKRYNQTEYVYGTAPNVFLKSVLDTMQAGAILLPAEGEGRNAVYAALLDWNVEATDLSKVGKDKALKLATQKGVSINYGIADATAFTTDKKYDVIAFIFLHLPPQIRKDAFRSYIPFLKPNGKIVMEVFNKEQINNASGGPKSLPMLYSLDELKAIFSDMNIEYAEDVVFELDEGAYHKGKASTSRIIVSNTAR